MSNTMNNTMKTIKVLNEKGEIVDLPAGYYTPSGHTHPGEAVKPSAEDREQFGFWGSAPGPSGYYTAYFWNAALKQAFFVIGCRHSASHMQTDIGQAALRVHRAEVELAEAQRALDALQS